MTVYDFRSNKPLPGSTPVLKLGGDWPVFAARENTVQDADGIHMYCRNGAGAGFMLKQPHAFGLWQVRSRIDVVPTADRHRTTKVCLLLWPAGTGWPPEIDFNESGDRDRSNQTFHYGADNRMLHTTYTADQTMWHTWGVRVDKTTVTYLCDGVIRAACDNMAPGTEWNVHVRTQPNLDTVSVTKMDVRWVEVTPS